MYLSTSVYVYFSICVSVYLRAVLDGCRRMFAWLFPRGVILPPAPPVQSWVGRGRTACSLTSNFGFGEREGRAQKKKRSKSARLGLVAQVVYLWFRSIEVRRCSSFGFLWIPRCSDWSSKCCLFMTFYRMAIVQAHMLLAVHVSFITSSTVEHAFTIAIVHACTEAIGYA